MSRLHVGPFEIVEPIGRGTMGRVYRARHRHADTPAALKVMTSDLATESHFQNRFRREVEAMAQLNHPAIATVFDLGEVSPEVAEASEGDWPLGSPWMAMEYIQGVALSGRVDTWNWPRVRWLVLALLDALSHAHAMGVIHRDLKPSNILVYHRPDVGVGLKLVDFGVARIVDPEEEADLEDLEDRVAGTPKYMAPEQVLGRRRDQGPWTDLYAVGCLAWRVLTGAPPFDEDDMEAVFSAHLEDPVPTLPADIEMPDGAQLWLERLLRKDPQARYRRAADAAQALLDLGTIDATEGFDRATTIWEHDSVASQPPGSLSEASTLTSQSSVDAEVPEEPFAEGDTGELADVSSVTEQVDLPASWRRPERHRKRPTLRGAGLGIFGLRRIPLVDRIEERDVLWDELRRCFAEDRPRAVVLSGDTGYGKSRLADWLARRGHETGAVSVMEARHDRRESPGHELGGMLARFFRCVGMEPIEVIRRMETLYEQLGLTGSNAHHDIIGISDLMVSGPLGRGEQALAKKGFQNPAERNRGLARLLRRLSQRRPLLMPMHDSHYGDETLSLVNFLLERSDEYGSAPIMMVLTRPKHLDRDLEARHSLERMSESPAVTHMTVGPLSDGAQQALTREVLGLDPDVADEVVRRTEGNPMFAVQLVEDWVQRGELELGPRGFRSSDGAVLDVPGDTIQMWNRRIDRLFESLDADLRCTVATCLETAAAMGRAHSGDEWDAICGAVGLGGSEKLLEKLVLTGLAERFSGGWRFRHTLLRECLERRSRESARWTDCHLRCIEVIEDLMDHRDAGYPIRLAGHFEAAGKGTEALPHLLDGVQRARQAGSYERAASLLERREHLLERLDLEDRCRYRVQNWIAHGELLTATGADRDARKWATRAIETARANGHLGELADALRLRAALRRESTDLKAALEDIERAIELYPERGDRSGLARARYIKGRIHQMRGESADAESAYVEAMEYFDEVGDDSMRALITCDIGYNWITQGRQEEARRAFEISRRLAQKVGNRRVAAKCWNRLGEIARFADNWGEARRAYQEAEQLFRVPGNQHVANLNLSLVEIAEGQYDAARSVLLLLENSFDPEGVHAPPLQMGLACCAAAQEDWETWDRRFRHCCDVVSETGLVHADLPWLAERAATIAETSGETDRARRGFRFAAAHAESMGDAEAARRLTGRADSLEESA